MAVCALRVTWGHSPTHRKRVGGWLSANHANSIVRQGVSTTLIYTVCLSPFDEGGFTEPGMGG
ncbi:MAG: hypothetical protein EDM05_65180 [Leptolyngbya sp. IPPAS B-1204]|uniref:Uncharacterized protein n=1 Tax=Leptolyngbya sp. NK1-12 TaxID=2547451 RepID=A0AA96WVN5_9CYAN|nr:hypothetical protein [Leptolyngbya sp. NK1-12]WNZ24507.1 hypothetical protein HJG54_17705 [Leptolyngbya sp. NK1-12]